MMQWMPAGIETPGIPMKYWPMGPFRFWCRHGQRKGSNSFSQVLYLFRLTWITLSRGDASKASLLCAEVGSLAGQELKASDVVRFRKVHKTQVWNSCIPIFLVNRCEKWYFHFFWGDTCSLTVMGGSSWGGRLDGSSHHAGQFKLNQCLAVVCVPNLSYFINATYVHPSNRCSKKKKWSEWEACRPESATKQSKDLGIGLQMYV